MLDLVSREWNGTPISRRITDGYVNATAMCKANGKEWFSYARTERAKDYIKALEAVPQICGTPAVQSIQGGQPELQGTWIHPRVAIDLARWVSPEFAVWMDGWLLDGFQQQHVAGAKTSVPALEPERVLDMIERSYDLLERFGVADDRDRLQFGDMVRNNAARAAGGYLLPPSSDDEELTLSDAWLEVTGQPLPRGKGTSIGKLIAAMYREEFNAEPPTRMQYVDGAPRKVKSYRRNFMLRAVDAVRSRLAA